MSSTDQTQLLAQWKALVAAEMRTKLRCGQCGSEALMEDDTGRYQEPADGLLCIKCAYVTSVASAKRLRREAVRNALLKTLGRAA